MSGVGAGAGDWLPEGRKENESEPPLPRSLDFQRSPPGSTRGAQGPEGGRGRGGVGLFVGPAGEHRGRTAGARAGGSAGAAARGERCAVRASLRAPVAGSALHHPFYSPRAGGAPFSGLPVPG